MGVKCEILLNNAKGVYRPGQSVDGIVKYTIKEPTNFKSVSLCLIGRGLCIWSPVISYVTVYTGTETFVDHRINLHQARDGETITIQPGTYEQPFCFVLPNGIPSTYKDIRSFIAYFILLKFVKPNYMSFSKKFILEFRVKGDRKPYLPDNSTYRLTKDFMLQNKSLNLDAQIQKTVVNAGEDIKVVLNIINEAEVNITGIKTEVVKYVTYKSDCGHEKQRSKVLHGDTIKNLDITKLNAETQLTHNVSTTPEMCSIYSNFFTKEYKVRVTLKYSFPYIEASVELPVIIAANVDDIEDQNPDDQPPPYWQVMNEKNEKD